MKKSSTERTRVARNTLFAVCLLLLSCQVQEQESSSEPLSDEPREDSEEPASPASLTNRSFLPTEVTLDRVLDGDTIDVLIGKKVHRVRLKGINTPERGECMSEEATLALTELTQGGFGLTTHGRGDRGRLMGYLTDASGRVIQEELAERGLALAYPYGKTDRFTERLAAAQERAEEARRGQFSPTACGAADVNLGKVKLKALDGNPSGDDLLFGGGESVTIEGPPNLALDGWTLKDTSASHRLTFPAGTTLNTKGQLRVYSSCGAPQEGHLYWCKKRSAVWNNTGDTAFLTDSKGNLVTQIRWAP